MDVHKKILFAIAACLYSCICAAQYRDLYQPPQVYADNQVKYRIMRVANHKLVSSRDDLFDKNGNDIIHFELDSSAKKIVEKSVQTYDTAHHLLSETWYHYHRYDPDTKEHTILPEPDTQQTVRVLMETNEANQLVGKTGYDVRGNVVYQAVYDRTTLTETKTYYRHDTVQETMVIHYDSHFYETSMTGKVYNDSNRIFSYEWAYKNRYDKQGKIINRKQTFTSSLNGKKQNEFYYKECVYEYSKRGLLMMKKFTEPSDGSDFYGFLTFKYIYYDE